MIRNNDYIVSKMLFRRLCIVILLLFTLVLTALMLYIPNAVKSLSEAAATDHASKTLQQFSILRQYYTDSVVQKIIDSNDLVVSHKHHNEKRVIPLPATMIKDLSEKYGQLNLKIMLYSPYPFRPSENLALSPLQQSIWQFLNKNPDTTYSETLRESGSTIVKVALADKMSSQNCVNCHNNHPLSPKTDWRVGDVRGVLQMTVDISEQVNKGTDLAFAIIVILTMLLICVLSFSYVMIKKEKLDVKLYFEATHDSLTGLSNRYVFSDRLDNALKVVKRRQNKAALFYIDLDDFKLINDEYGHPAGDVILVEVAKRLTDISRETDTVVRLGGDEFAILFCDFDDADFIQHIAQRINESISQPFGYQGHELKLGCSIGIAIAVDHIDNAADLTEMSDKAMYLAKKSGKNSYHIYTK